MLSDVSEANQKVGLTMNLSNTKIMKNEYIDEDLEETIKFKDRVIDEINHYIYLGSS